MRKCFQGNDTREWTRSQLNGGLHRSYDCNQCNSSPNARFRFVPQLASSVPIHNAGQYCRTVTHVMDLTSLGPSKTYITEQAVNMFSHRSPGNSAVILGNFGSHSSVRVATSDTERLIAQNNVSSRMSRTLNSAYVTVTHSISHSKHSGPGKPTIDSKVCSVCHAT